MALANMDLKTKIGLILGRGRKREEEEEEEEDGGAKIKQAKVWNSMVLYGFLV